jgi:hypothetical protein
VLLHFPVSHSVDESIGCLSLVKVNRSPDQGAVRQLLDGCRNLMKCLADQIF